MMDNSVSSNGFPSSFAGSVPVVTNSTPPPAAETVPRSSPRQRLLAALTGLLPRNLRASNRPSGGATSPSSLYKRASGALTVTAFLAVLAFGLLFLLPGGPAWAQDADTIEYAENGTGPVATYSAVDPEGVVITWSLSGDDAADFTIAGGVLAFVKSPNFEAPADEAPADNIYEIMVEATDGTGHVGRETVKVEVTNVDEAGTVGLSALQPAPGVMFTATLTDIDGPADLTGSAEWQWSRSLSKSSGWVDIDKATKSAYEPDEDGEDEDYYLRATAKYTDRQSPSGADNDKTAFMVSANKVLALRSSNKVPEFAEVQDPEGVDDDEAIAKRAVTETAAAGQLVGDPVTAKDEDDDDVLTYTLADASGNFVIDWATGQISVAKGAKFNVTADADIVVVVDGNDMRIDADEYMVTVIATDPKGIPNEMVTAVGEDNDALARDTVMVLITVDAVDEPPIFTVTSDGAFTNVGKFAAVSFDEVTGIDIALATFIANDPETATTTTLGIRGADSSKFAINAGGELTFKAAPGFAAPNFEKPADADKDNVYEVTITAADGNANMATRDVKVTVTNAEEAGTVKLSQPRPRVGVAITASYSDLDGGLASTEWQWWRTDAVNPVAPAVPDLTVLFDSGDAAWLRIEDATSASYMPVADESDVGRYLLAVVRYTDAKQNVGEARDIAGLVSVNPVAKDTRNRAPVFEDQDSDTPGTQNQTATREVAENTKANVGNAVIAEDPDPNADPLIYRLSGADAALFSVTDANLVDDKGGQIKVKSTTKLDFETKASYTVTLTATDSFSDSASIDVTIMVTDADEEPDVTGDATKEYAENDTGSVAVYTADDPEGVAIKWSLSGTDASLFSIEGGVLAFVKSPNFEAPADEAPADNIYEIMVEATDGTGHVGREAVKVEVTNVDEDGTVKLSALQPAPKVLFTATLTDIDGPADLTGSAEWQWSRSKSPSRGWVDIDKATKSAYEPDEDDEDEDYYLRATAKYTDRQSPSGADNDKTAFMVSANKVLALRSSNKVPEFAEVQDPEGVDDDEAIAKRAVTETAAAGQLVGDPVTAKDEDDDDVLTYTLADASGNFVIDWATGQISVAKGAKFNVTADADIVVVVDGNDMRIDADEYMVTVIATDPKGIPNEMVTAVGEDNDALARDTVMVLITVDAVDEPPIFTVTSDGAFTNVGKFAAVSFDEVTGIDIALATFIANDPETATTTTLGIRGADSSKFAINAGGELTFKAAPGFAAPNFEKPADADKDNVYEVTITAADGNANMATRDVKVTVTNAEEAGTVKLSQPRPRVGVAITASYSDLDGGLASTEWQWWRTDAVNPVAPAVPDLMVLFDSGDAAWLRIEDATSASYKPVLDNGDDTDESDVGRYLLAVVRYTDAKQNVGEARDIAGLVSVNPVAKDTRNRAPVFEDQDSDTPGTQNQTATREVAENTKANVGNAVIAEDPDPNADPLIYRLSGADAALFSVTDANLVDDKGGQIKVKSTTKLDFETKASYTVTLTATDSFSDSASIDVTIMVTDVDEAPKIMRAPDANVAPEFASTTITRTVLENTAAGENIGNPVEATDDNNDTLTYALNGTDAASFDIDPATGQLMTKAALDFETEATYSVTVAASDSGGLSDSIDVTITVTDVDEAQVITGDAAPNYAENGTGPVATYTATDPESATITWSLEGDDAADFEISASGVLTFGSPPDHENPADADQDNVYEVTVKASAGTNEDTLDVTITVTNVDEGFEVSGTAAVDYAENGTAAVATYSATDLESATITWSLEGDDAADFEISAGGMLTFVSSPDHENPADADRDNVYEVTVKASDGTNEDTLDVTITVTDVDEDVTPADPLVDRYDADGNGEIERAEVFAAIDDYLDEGADAPTRADVFKLIDLYLGD